MKLVLIGNGVMGQLVAKRARHAGHEIGTILGSAAAAHGIEELAHQLREHDVAIDFSVSGAVLKNVTACAHAGVPLVEGTTGWQAQENQVRQIILEHGAALVYGSNFSIGVNIFYRVVAHAAALFASVPDYASFVEEAHHARKRDVPSGTALSLIALLKQHSEQDIPVASTRAGYIPGTHRVGFDSTADQITLTHTARSREGFAAGALLAANWIVGRKGVYEFSKVIDETIGDK